MIVSLTNTGSQRISPSTITTGTTTLCPFNLKRGSDSLCELPTLAHYRKDLYYLNRRQFSYYNTVYPNNVTLFSRFRNSILNRSFDT